MASTPTGDDAGGGVIPSAYSDRMAKKPTPQSIVEGFILRARRIMEHSLIRDQAEMMEKLHAGEVKVAVTVNTKTGEETYRLQAEYPDEEILESLASRVRPLILSSEPIYYDKVLDALAEVVGAEKLGEQIDLEWWREFWREIIDANRNAQAYLLTTRNGSITDRKLMYAWLYGDVVHAASPRSPIVRELSIDDRFQAAAHGVARICDRVIYTAMMLKTLIEDGLLKVSSDVLTDDVVVTTTTLDKEVRALTAPVDAPLPEDLSDLDPTVWQTLHQSIENDRQAEVEEITGDGSTD
ncbi:MAG: hypothetical protein C0482_22825 [Gordonia sp.]|nr:hypothetical protein [Gordonia sp. (in: high G+C Gram-positive bacteria)]